MPAAFYERLSDDRFASTSATAGPWGPTLSHGSPPAALLLRTIERALPREDVRVARIAFDFLGPVAVAEVTMSAEMVRPGARIELCRSRLAVGGRPAMEATAWRISATPGRVPEIRDPRPAPPLPSGRTTTLFEDAPSFGYGEAIEWRFVDGGFDRAGPATVYSRPLLPLVEGEAVSPLGRLLLMVDSANGISFELSFRRFTFVPVELTVSVLRHPRTEWVGMSARTTIDGDGIGHTHADLFDEAGYLGTALQTLFVSPIVSPASRKP
jgi:hypothetical protein